MHFTNELYMKWPSQNGEVVYRGVICGKRVNWEDGSHTPLSTCVQSLRRSLGKETQHELEFWGRTRSVQERMDEYQRALMGQYYGELHMIFDAARTEVQALIVQHLTSQFGPRHFIRDLETVADDIEETLYINADHDLATYQDTSTLLMRIETALHTHHANYLAPTDDEWSNIVSCSDSEDEGEEVESLKLKLEVFETASLQQIHDANKEVCFAMTKYQQVVESVAATKRDLEHSIETARAVRQRR